MPQLKNAVHNRRAITLLFNITCVIFGMLAAFMAAELLLRAAGFSYLLYPSRLEFGYPARKELHDAYDPDAQLMWVRKDYSEHLAAVGRHAPRVLFMGDSCTAYGEYATHFMRILNEEKNISLQAAWLGEPGYTSYQGLQQLVRDALPLRPAIVAFYYGWNDHWKGFGVTDSQAGYIHVPLHASLSRSRVYQLVLKSLIHLLQKLKGESPLRVPPADYAKNLRRMALLSRGHNSIPGFITAPTSHRKGHEPAYLGTRWLYDISDLVPLHQAYIEVLQKVAKEEKVLVCDMHAFFAALEHRHGELFLSDGIHLTPQGQELQGRFLVDCFLKHGLLAEVRSQPA